MSLSRNLRRFSQPLSILSKSSAAQRSDGDGVACSACACACACVCVRLAQCQSLHLYVVCWSSETKLARLANLKS
jgi:hypothetical protein